MSGLMPLRPEQVLDAHAHLARTFWQPVPAVRSFLKWFMTDAYARSTDRAQGLFYPVFHRPGEKVTEKDAEVLARSIGLGLREAVTYQVTADMVATMRDVYDNSMREIEHIEAEEVPGERGFVWLDRYWVLAGARSGSKAAIDAAGEGTEVQYNRVRALSWDLTQVRTTGTDEEKVPDQLWPCARVSLWSYSEDDRDESKMDPDLITDVERDLGILSLLHTCVVPFGLRFAKPTAASDSVDSMLGLVHILWMFLGMEITSTRTPRINNHWKKKALRSIKHGEVHVVVLRRVTHPDTGEEVEHREVDWTCQWVVQGHWRHLDKPLKPHHAVAAGADKHCLQCGGELTWVRPYIKGPDGKPLKVSRTLMRLARLWLR